MSLAPPTQRPTGWLHLPNELKLPILEHYLAYPKVLDRKLLPIVFKLRLDPLLRTDIPGLAGLATNVFSKSNTFSISSVDICLGLPPIWASNEIESLEFVVPSFPMGFSIAISPSHDNSSIKSRLRTSILANESLKPIAQRWCFGWEKAFTRLRSLHLVIDYMRKDMSLWKQSGMGDFCFLAELHTVVSPVVANMHFEELEVTLVCKKFCPRERVGHEGGACPCVKEIEDTIKADIMAAKNI